jgi:hypothetical protein
MFVDRSWHGLLWGCAALIGCSTSDGSPPLNDKPLSTSASVAAQSASPHASVVAAPPSAASGSGGAAAPARTPDVTPTPTQTSSASNAPSLAKQEPKIVSGLPTGPAAPANELAPAQDLVRVVPTDIRAVQHAARTPVPISGGSLIASADGHYAVLSDPERDRVSIVDLWFNLLSATIALQTGDEPGRLVEDGAGRVHVALRSAGAVVSIDLRTFAITNRRAVCTAPRGIAYDAASQQLHVACASGELVSLPAASGDVSARVKPTSDLRDVAVSSDGVYVTRLKRAELLKLDAARAVMGTYRPLTPRLTFQEPSGSQIVDTLEPELARRTVVSHSGGFYMLHQGARNGEIQLQSADDLASSTSSPYGGAGGTCTGVVNTELTHFDASGQVVSTSLIGGVLVVDVAESALNGELAVAVAGALDVAQPVATFVSQAEAAMPAQFPAGAMQPSMPNQNGVFVFDRTTLDQPNIVAGAPGCIGVTRFVPLDGQATSVAYLSDGRLLVQSREPAALFVVPSPNDQTASTSTTIALGGASMYDSGHEIFHRDAGAGIACASCHAEGIDDGHVWHFADQGARRTQSLDVGLEGTAPFHWVGDMDNVAKLMEQVFVGRMGGVHQSDARRTALEQWLYSIKAPTPLRAANDAAVLRGHTLFTGAAGCSDCHTGAKFTNNQTVDVGKGLLLQVPSLVGIGYRGPFMHDGCAATLRDRFNPNCGGALHGKTAGLSGEQIDDLVAYLESI